MISPKNAQLESLRVKAHVTFANKKPDAVAKMLPSMVDKGFQMIEVGNINEAFILLQRYFNVIKWLKTTRDYKTKPSHYTAYMADARVKQARKALDSVENQILSQFPTPNNITQLTVNSNSQAPAQTTDKTMELVMNLPEAPMNEPIADEPDDFITCLNLFELFKKGRYLIIDIRPSEDYDYSRIRSKHIVNIPSRVIKGGILAGKYAGYFQANRPSEALIYEMRGRTYVDTVILMDWSTKQIDLTTDNPLVILRTVLKEWDPGQNIADIVILDGGYTEWLNFYPNTVTNPKVTPPDVLADEISDDYQYPENLIDDNPPVQPQSRKNHQSNVPNSNNSYVSPNQSTRPYYSPDPAMDTGAEILRLSQDVEDMNLDSRNVTIRRPPTVDRSSKPAKQPRHPQAETFMRYLSQRSDILTSQEKLEKQLLEFDITQYQMSDDKDYDPDEIHERRAAVQLTLNDILEQKNQVEKELEGLKDVPAELTDSDRSEKMKLDMRQFDITSRIKSISLERQSHQKNDEARRQSLLSPAKQNNNDIHREPLKSDGSSSSAGLKRSLSSPNLAQVKKTKIDDSIKDRKVPQVDRSSKPSDVHKNRENNNIAPIISRDPSKRMDAVYRIGTPGITGLKNLGNSCYMNSILQCLSNTAFLSKYFIENSYSDDLNTNSANETRGQIAEEFAQVIKALWRGQYKCIAPRDLKNTIGQYHVEFDNCDQQDSHEFLTFFLDWMHNDLRKPEKIHRDRPLSAAEKEWDKALESQSSVISHLFIGQLRSSITCLTCATRSITYETFNSLSISLPDPNQCSLDDCLRHFLSGQRISDWTCPKCKAPREATKKFDFVKLAPIMVIHLNRFTGTVFGLEKKNTHVNFPLHNLNLKPYLAIDSDSTHTIKRPQHYNYNLYALSNHHGSMGGGHYTAFCKSATLSKWYEYNDQSVTEIDETHVRGQNRSAYLLFYSSLQCEILG